jgi:hypothetical protein
VEASNSCVITLIFGSFSFIVFLLEFFLHFIHPFYFLGLVFYCIFSFFSLVFYPLYFLSSFSLLLCLRFSAYVVSSLSYPNLLETERFDCDVAVIKKYLVKSSAHKLSRKLFMS